MGLAAWVVALGAGWTLGACAPKATIQPEAVPHVSWPTLLGDARRAGYAGQAAPHSPQVAWSVNAGRGLLAPPLAAPPMLFLATGNRLALAISSDTGEPYWERRLDGAVGTGLVAGNGLLYAVDEERDGVVYALKPGNGRVAWQKSVGYGAAAPLLLGDTLVLTLHNGLVLALGAAGAAAGDRLWSTRLPDAAAGTPVAYGDALIVAARNDSVYALRRRDGQLMARAALGGFASASPALAGDTLYVPLEVGGVLAMRVPGLQILFRASPGTGGGELPTKSAGRIAADSAAITPPGTKGRGPTVPAGAAVLAAPVVAADGSVYFLDAGAQLWRLQPGEWIPRLLAELGGAARGALTLTRDGLLVGKLDGMLTLVRFDGSIAWSRKLNGSISAPAAVVDGVAYVPLQQGRIVKVR